MYIVRQTEEFVAWLDELKDKRAQVRIAARLRQAESGSLGDWQPVAGEVSELRVHYGLGTGCTSLVAGRSSLSCCTGTQAISQPKNAISAER